MLMWQNAPIWLRREDSTEAIPIPSTGLRYVDDLVTELIKIPGFRVSFRSIGIYLPNGDEMLSTITRLETIVLENSTTEVGSELNPFIVKIRHKPVYLSKRPETKPVSPKALKRSRICWRVFTSFCVLNDWFERTRIISTLQSQFRRFSTTEKDYGARH